MFVFSSGKKISGRTVADLWSYLVPVRRLMECGARPVLVFGSGKKIN